MTDLAILLTNKHCYKHHNKQSYKPTLVLTFVIVVKAYVLCIA